MSIMNIMNRLINDTLINAGILADIANTPEPQSMWFRGVNFHDVFFNLLVPLVFVIGIAFIAKARYERRNRVLHQDENMI